MNLKTIARYLSVYLLWLIVLALGVWFALLSHSALLGLAAKYYIDDQFMRQMLVRFLDKSYMVMIGLIWLVLMIVTEESFRRGAAKGLLFQRFALISGIELLLIFCFDLLILILQNWTFDLLRLVNLIAECVLGIGLIVTWKVRRTSEVN
jgi:hypothetical protein